MGILEKENEIRKAKDKEMIMRLETILEQNALVLEKGALVLEKENEIRKAKDEEIKLLKETIMEIDGLILEKENEKRISDELLEIKDDEIKQYQTSLIKNEEIITAICTNLN